MIDDIDKSKLNIFFENLEEKNPFLVFIYMVISFGTYIVYWIFNLNYRFELLDEDAPDSKRGITILLILPLTTYIVLFVLEELLFREFKYFLVLNLIIWGIITLLTMKFLFDFSIFFGKVTNSNGTVWYLCMYPGYYSIVFAAFGIYNTVSLILFTMVTISVMQVRLNIAKEKNFVKSKSMIFNSKGRKYS